MSTSNPNSYLKAQIHQQALELGFHLFGVSPAPPYSETKAFPLWLEQGFAASMHYLKNRQEERMDLEKYFPNAKSIISCGIFYAKKDIEKPQHHQPKISRYARGQDYHGLMKKRLKKLARFLQSKISCNTRVCVDTAPVSDRIFGYHAGLGWFGKNTCLINREKGSYFFLGEILTDITLPPDLKETDHCGTCSRCLEACPTQAFPQPYVLDSNKCISYWTIEHRGTIPDEIKTKIQGHLFGCDVCQEVCPWNDGSHKNKKKQNGFHLDPSFSSIESTTQTLTRIFQTSEVEFNKNFEGRPLKRSKWQGLVRNAAIVIGNLKLKNFKNDLESVLPKNQKDHPELTEEIKWALEKLK